MHKAYILSALLAVIVTIDQIELREVRKIDTEAFTAVERAEQTMVASRKVMQAQDDLIAHQKDHIQKLESELRACTPQPTGAKYDGTGTAE